MLSKKNDSVELELVFKSEAGILGQVYSLLRIF